jgi:hypothetical protein
MSSLRDYEVDGLDEFFADEREAFAALKMGNPKAFTDFWKKWDEWLANPEKQCFDSHKVRGHYGDSGWFLWRSQFNPYTLRMFFLVHDGKERFLPVSIKNDHDYSSPTLQKLTRRGLWRAKKSHEAKVRACEKTLQRIEQEIASACVTLLI